VALYGIAFLAGLITALSPCVLPVLPILLAGGATGRRPYAIVLGLVGSFSVFTVVGASLLDALGLPADFLRNLALVLLFVLAATLLVPGLAGLLERPLLFLTRRRPRTEGGGVLLGASLGLVFVPCAGPVLAAVTALSATGEDGFDTFLVAFVYALGAAGPMLAIAAGGQRLPRALGLVRRHAEGTRRVAGALIAATALAIVLGADQRLATTIPGYTAALQDKVERSDAAKQELRKLRGPGEALPIVSEGRSSIAPALRGITDWINTEPLTIRELRGKVVLIDFWTYSCINCLRTLPHLKAWDRTYRKDGLVIIGVHAPEFAFERVPGNVRTAVRKLGIEYPVALDNDYDTWTAYANQYWPAKYLIDRTGRVRFFHFGEGEYDQTETEIRRYLGENGVPKTKVPDPTPTGPLTPESYLGYERLDRTAALVAVNQESTYRFPERQLAPDELAFAGRIRVEPERIVTGRGARLRLQFRARKVHLVLGGSGAVSVLLDGRVQRTVEVGGEPRLYTLLSLDRFRAGLLELRFTPGLEAYAFTFG
jgi:cytochrome c biogenesis protein CcdA/thiol-disulfide isomerase/thioredoxin